MSLSLKNRTFDLRSYNNSTATPDVSSNILPDLTASIITTGTFGANVDVYSKTYINNTFTIAAEKITSGTLPAARIGTGSITTTHIEDNTIVDGDINSSANISGSKIADASIPAGKITGLSLLSSNILDNQITYEKLSITTRPNYSTILGGTIQETGAANYLGYSVTLSNDGTTLAIGVPSANYARVYRLSAGKKWTQMSASTIQITGGATDTGAAVALSGNGNTLAVGAPSASAGFVNIYTYNSGTSTWTNTFTGVGALAGDKTGQSLSLNLAGTRLATGIPVGDQGGVTNIGIGTIRDLVSNSWATIKATIPRTGTITTADRKGVSISLSSTGNALVIGSDNASTGTGLIEMYSSDASGTTWTLRSTFTGKTTSSFFGFSSAMSGDGNVVVAGAWGWNSEKGYAQVFRLNNLIWTQLGTDINAETTDMRMGYSLAVSNIGNIVVIGSPYATGVGMPTRSGSVRVYKFNSTSWFQTIAPIHGTVADENFGTSVSISGNGDILAIGSAAGRVSTYTINTLY
jgi:hypothetical protein